MNRILKVVALVGLVAMVACAKDKTKDADDGSGSGSSSRPYKSPTTGSSGSSVVGSPSSTGEGGMPGSNIVHFEFDSSDLNADGQAVIDAWAAYLQASPSARVRLEGHADERGTPEYNVGLGERRGNAVLQALTAKGVGERQLNVTSFGEERPVATGHDESSWSQNRRVEIVQ
jgi:peptidoglycan-associated lipoprotein